MNKNNYLAHYGVMGMKWGVRRYQPYPSGTGPKGKYVGSKARRHEKKVAKLQKKADKIVNLRNTHQSDWSKESVKKGIRDNKGKLVLSPNDVQQIVKNTDAHYKGKLNKIDSKYNKAIEKMQFSEERKAAKVSGFKKVARTSARAAASVASVYAVDTALLKLGGITPGNAVVRGVKWTAAYHILKEAGF